MMKLTLTVFKNGNTEYYQVTLSLMDKMSWKEKQKALKIYMIIIQNIY